MNIGPGNIEALLLDALEGRLSAADAEMVWAALEAHPEWGVSWDFDDRELQRLQAEDVPAMDWSGLKKEVVTDQQIRQALRQDRHLHTLDATLKQSLYQREERVMWRYWAAAASVALLVWLAWPTSNRSDVPSIAGAATVAADTSSAIVPAPIEPGQQLVIDPGQQLATDHRSTSLVERHTNMQEERIFIEHSNSTQEQIQEEILPKKLPPSEEEWNMAQAKDTSSLEAPLELPFDLPPSQDMAVIEQIIPVPPSTTKTESNTYTPLEWLKMKAGQIAARKEADGTLPTVRRDKQSFNLQWGSLSINAH